jgi:hypothetical protein
VAHGSQHAKLLHLLPIDMRTVLSVVIRMVDQYFCRQLDISADEALGGWFELNENNTKKSAYGAEN